MDDLIGAWRQAPARIVAVSDEVGSGVVPATRSGRLFRDRLGQLNQRLAAESEEVVLVVAGRIPDHTDMTRNKPLSMDSLAERPEAVALELLSSMS